LINKYPIPIPDNRDKKEKLALFGRKYFHLRARKLKENIKQKQARIT